MDTLEKPSPVEDLYSLPDALRVRASDIDSLSHHVGPKNIAGVRMALLILADIISGDGALIYQRPAVTKRRLD